MARTTALDLITAALKELAVLSEGEVPSGAASSDALDSLNALIDQWAAEKLTIPVLTRTTSTLTANQASFTVGSGGNINIVRPVYIEKVNYVDTSTDPDTEYQLPPLLTEAAWIAETQKARTGTVPQKAYYSPAYPTGTLYPLPIPTSATLLWAIYHWAALVELALADAFSLRPAYERMIVKNLALELAPLWEREPSALLIRQAMQAMDIVKRVNFRLSDLSFSGDALFGSNGGGWNIRTGP